MATKIQSWFRGMKHRRVHGNKRADCDYPFLCQRFGCPYCFLYYMKKFLWPKRPPAAIKIQSLWRRLKAQRALKDLKWRKTRIIAATKIQSFQRWLKAQCAFKDLKIIIKIQSWWRKEKMHYWWIHDPFAPSFTHAWSGYFAGMRNYLRWEKMVAPAAILVQSFWRKLKAKQETN